MGSVSIPGSGEGCGAPRPPRGWELQTLPHEQIPILASRGQSKPCSQRSAGAAGEVRCAGGWGRCLTGRWGPVSREQVSWDGDSFPFWKLRQVPCASCVRPSIATKEPTHVASHCSGRTRFCAGYQRLPAPQPLANTSSPSSGRPLPAVPQPSLCLAGPAAWSTLPSLSHTESRPPRKPSLTLSCHCPACPVSHGGRRGFSNWLLIPWEGRGIKRGWGETGRALRPLHTAPSDPLPPRVPTYT